MMTKQRGTPVAKGLFVEIEGVDWRMTLRV
jgi:hypothetical protein